MHDPASSPDGPSQPGQPLDPGGDSPGYEVAHEIVGMVIAWYSRQLLLARRSGDQQRLDELKTRRQECVEDQHRLRDAEPEEVGRIADVYTERLKELEASESQAEE
ncbi:hypothetical protein [Streptomyces malaysiensis]|uniref:Uncharacterized protein n=1 Tax=Streptomyces malaysiensis subsp. samsunensis TaxID=459658 RepID=A0A9X2M9Z0_STRMQ|nr:hypothetical protein [Streptomyces samsunensis]MCQ8835804.1 hypothetical protein [Streptomyces samsunensis]